MEQQLYELIGNPNYLSSGDVYDLYLKHKFSQDKLASVVGNDLAKLIVSNRIKTVTLGGFADECFKSPGEDYTQIYVWGSASSGKTALICAVLSALQDQCKNIIWEEHGENVERQRKELLDCFRKDIGYYMKLQDGPSSDIVTIINLECHIKKHLTTDCYPLSFIEARCDKGDIGLAADLLYSRNNKIHLLCFDCSQSQQQQMEQVQAFTHLLTKLEKSFDTTVGIYIVVTKTDTMFNVPDDFKANAAQTLITAKHKQLWQRVQRICYDKFIYDSTPIPFSIGNVVLKDILVPCLTDARKMIQAPILLKSVRRPGLIHKMLWSLGRKTTTTTIIVVIVTLAFAFITALDLISILPEENFVAYDFEKDFIKRVNEKIPGDSMSTCKEAFEDLRSELSVEHGITLSDGRKLTDVTVKCDSVLTNSFAIEIEKDYDSIYRQSNWSTDEKLDRRLMKNGEYINKMIGEPIFEKTTLIQNRQDTLLELRSFYDSLCHVEDLISLSKKCEKIDDVFKVLNNVDHYKVFPYSKDSLLNRDLAKAKTNAWNSYVQYLFDGAKSLRSNFNRKPRNRRNISNFINTTKNLKDEIQCAINNVYNEKDVYQDAYNTLIKARTKLNPYQR